MPSNQCCSCRLSEIPEQRPLSGTARYALFRRFEFVGKEIFVGIRDEAELHRLQEGYIAPQGRAAYFGLHKGVNCFGDVGRTLANDVPPEGTKKFRWEAGQKLDAVQSSCDFIAI